MLSMAFLPPRRTASEREFKDAARIWEQAARQNAEKAAAQNIADLTREEVQRRASSGPDFGMIRVAAFITTRRSVNCVRSRRIAALENALFACHMPSIHGD